MDTPQTPHLPVGLKIKLARTQRQLRQEDLAAEIGISKYQILRLEKGKHDPSSRTAKRLAEFFGTPPDYFEAPPDQPELTEDGLAEELRHQRLRILNLERQVQELLEALGSLLDSRGVHRNERARLAGLATWPSDSRPLSAS